LTVSECGDPWMVTVPVPGVPTALPTITVRVWPITVMMPLKLASWFPGAAVNVIEPDPVPDAVPPAPEVIVSQVALDTADHTHPVCVDKRGTDGTGPIL
jgi:hypothetical protein